MCPGFSTGRIVEERIADLAFGHGWALFTLLNGDWGAAKVTSRQILVKGGGVSNIAVKKGMSFAEVEKLTLERNAQESHM